MALSSWWYVCTFCRRGFCANAFCRPLRTRPSILFRCVPSRAVAHSKAPSALPRSPAPSVLPETTIWKCRARGWSTTCGTTAEYQVSPTAPSIGIIGKRDACTIRRAYSGCPTFSSTSASACSACSEKDIAQIKAMSACKHPDCAFPFTYYGVTYNACTDIGEKGKGSWDYTWCSTETVFKVGSNNYRKCDGCSPTDAGCKACADDEKSEKAETGLACRCRSGFFDINPDADDLVCTKLGEGCEKSSKSSPCTQCFDNATATLSADKKRCVCRAGYVTELDRSIVHGKPTKTW